MISDLHDVEDAEQETRERLKVKNDHERDIRDFRSLISTTTRIKQLEPARLYFYYVLDCLVDLAYLVSEDFFARPHLYIDAGGVEAAMKLGALRAEYGTSVFVPNKAQREHTYHAIFGPKIELTDANDDFAYFRNGLLQAASAFAERVFDTGEEMLRAQVRTANRSLKAYLESNHGDALKLVACVMLPALTEQLCYNVFRTSGISAVFGIAYPPSQKWPYDQDTNGDKLVEVISKHFGLYPLLTRERINSLQRVAARGAEAIAAVIEFNEASGDAEMDRLITRCYTWGAALDGISPMRDGASTETSNRALLEGLRSR